MAPGARQVDAPIGRDPRNRLRMAVVDLERHAGKPARTLIERLDSNARRLRRALHARNRPHPPDPRAHGVDRASAGRRRALRRAPAAGLARQALHAFRLAIRAPCDADAAGVPLLPPPADLRAGRLRMGAGLQFAPDGPEGRAGRPMPALRCTSPRAGNAAFIHPEQASSRRLFPDNANHEYGGCQAHSRKPP